MKETSPGWLLVLLLAVCFTLATVFVPRASWWNEVPRAADRDKNQSASDNVFKLWLGEGRRLFGNQMFAMADAYFHSGYYPSIFDRPVTEADVAERSDEGKGENQDATSDDFFGPPPDWIAALDRLFVPNQHTHLDSGGAAGNMKSAEVQEILPWLKLATDMNPQYVDAYRVGYYWLHRLHKPAEARDFLLEGLRNNPGNSGLLFDLGCLYQQDFHDPKRARNVWQAALRCWQAQSDDAKNTVEAKRICDDITINLAHLEEDAGNLQEAVKYLEITKGVSPNPDAIQKQIDELKKKMAGQSDATHP
jgi:tetratricopeptide (TPR) repeat protein